MTDANAQSSPFHEKLNDHSRQIGSWIGFALSLAVIYTIAISLLDESLVRFFSIAAGVAIVLFTQPLSSQPFFKQSNLRVVAACSLDTLLLAGMSFSGYWFFMLQDVIWSGLYSPSTPDLIAGLIGLAVVLECTRRAWGIALVIVAMAFIAFAFSGPHLPGILHHYGVDLSEFLFTVWYSFDGVFGRLTGLVASVVLIYLIFGAILENTGAGESLIKMASSLTSHVRGGSAHTAIVASAVFGMMSGSVAANIASTGVFTIPMIKRQGFRPAFAGAVEAVASSTGQITPPIMAAAAFVMADMVGVTYLTVITAALLPATFKFLSLFAQVHAEAVRHDIKPEPVENRVRLTKSDWTNSLLIFIPIVVLMGSFFAGSSPGFAGFCGVVSAIIAGFALNPEFRRNPFKIILAMRQGGLDGGRIMVSVAAIGIVLGVLNETGFSIRFASEIAGFSEGSVFLTLLMAMLGALVLGMGLPTLPAYLIIALMLTPALVEAGIPMLAAHLFVLYYAVYSSIVPPVAYACYVAAPIAGAHPLAISLTSLRLSIIGLLVPFAFVFNTSLLLVLDFSFWQFCWALSAMLISIWLAASGCGGASIGNASLNTGNRLLRVVLAVTILVPYPVVAVPAAIAGLVLVTLDFHHRKSCALTLSLK
ncbi:hypothetical protein GCM10011348_33760 [Marinobacterium nitratireducens]|uniref:TRAP C4-dicarboxylate transport system permease DctM subunit domain-containing protein n=1 Tax=Marinobacterium nitratireducens TaxID=518897 RepID=A0A917ZLQ3_9GAMM|nr:TRAP transporter fused permease subunit [Marinobacterium nitratireducens]GGO85375.1 hypothetical protein GCM10011348_33760 [Marinobacterium nitratireducens]